VARFTIKHDVILQRKNRSERSCQSDALPCNCALAEVDLRHFTEHLHAMDQHGRRATRVKSRISTSHNGQVLEAQSSCQTHKNDAFSIAHVSCETVQAGVLCNFQDCTVNLKDGSMLWANVPYIILLASACFYHPLALKSFNMSLVVSSIVLYLMPNTALDFDVSNLGVRFVFSLIPSAALTVKRLRQMGNMHKQATHTPFFPAG
jgi:hypothetical protein